MAQLFLCFFLLIATLGTRVLLYQFTPGFHEYESVFLYVSDIFLIVFFIVAGYEARNYTKLRKLRSESKIVHRSLTSYFLLLTSFFALVSIFLASSKLLALYQFVRLLALVAMAFAMARVVREKKMFQKVLAIIAAIAIVQSLIGIAQFAHQEAASLSWLGESPVSATDGASSKILIGGARVLRAYGLFPHPNILGAFLVLGLLALVYFYLQTDKELYEKMFDWRKGIGENFRRFIKSRYLYVRTLLAIGIFIVLTGLTLSFSRSTWLAATVSSVCFISFAIVSRTITIRGALRLVFILVASGYTLVALFNPFILPRTSLSLAEPAVEMRLSYNKLGLYLIKEHPWGVGMGNQVFHSVREKVYQEFSMVEVWQWQPIHNIYLLIANEIGIIGLIAFIGFIICLLGHWILSRRWTLENVIPQAMLLALLALGLFDHFLWTIWQGQVMLWLAIGLAMASARSSTDRMHPSEG